MFLKHELWCKYNTSVSAQDFPSELQLVYRVLDSFHRVNEKQENLSVSDLATLFFSNPVKDKEYYHSLFANLESYQPNEHAVATYIGSLKRAALLREAALKAFEASEGRGSYVETLELFKSLVALPDAFEAPPEPEDTFVSTKLSELLTESYTKPGLKWRLGCLNKSLGSLRKSNFGFIFAYVETGKCHGKGTPIMMFDGSIKNVEDIVDGEFVMGPDSQPRLVTGTTKGTGELFKVEYPHGESYIVNKDHVLPLIGDKDIHFTASVEEFLTFPEWKKKQSRGWKTGVEFPEKELKIDPYLLGVWLGDGTSENTTVTTKDPEIIQALGEYADSYRCSLSVFERASQGKALSVSIVKKKGLLNQFKEELKFYNLIKNKHIPDVYLRSSIKQRKALLAGLLDTDGYLSRTMYEIVQSREHLAASIEWLARSVGLHATTNLKYIKGVLYYRVLISGDCTELPLRITYKQQVLKPTQKCKSLKFGLKITPLGIGEYYGFCVDKDHLYLLGDFTVTHNTTFLASETTHMFEQLQPDEYLHWYNNEQAGGEVMLRVYQAFFGLQLEQLYSNTTHYEKLFQEATQGRFLMKDSASITVSQVEKLCSKYKPGLIVFDQLDKIKGVGDKEDRDDLRLGQKFKWAREIGKTFAPVIGVTQADSNGAHKQWLSMDEVAGAKVAKQAEADWILGIGKSFKDGFEYTRYLNLVKNKLPGDFGSTDPKQRHAKLTCSINPEIARYEDIS